MPFTFSVAYLSFYVSILIGQESCYDELSLRNQMHNNIGQNEKNLKGNTKKKEIEWKSAYEQTLRRKSPELKKVEKEENVEIFHKLLKISSATKNEEKIFVNKQKSRSSTEKGYIMVSEEEFYEINNIERENVGYLINDYFDANFDRQTFNKKKTKMKERAKKFHHDHRMRICEFYDQINHLKSPELMRENLYPLKKHRSFLLTSNPDLLLFKSPDYFSKYNFTFIHMDLMVSEKQKKYLDQKFPTKLEEEKCLKRLMKVYKENKKKFWIDNHHYNKVIGNHFKEKIEKKCCKQAENSGIICHPIKYTLMTFYKLMEEALKDHNYGKLLLLTYDYYFTPENFFMELVKLFFIPTPIMLSKQEAQKYELYKIFPKQKKIFSLITVWSEHRPFDFCYFSGLMNYLRCFLLLTELIFKGKFSKEAQLINERVSQGFKIKSSLNIINPKNEGKLITSIDLKTNPLEFNLNKVISLISYEIHIFFLIDTESLVQQLCLIDFELQKEIKPHILSEYYKTPVSCDSLNKVIQRYNYLTYYFILVIILQKDIQDKKKIIIKYLEIAEKCKKFNNFQCLMSVCNALSHLLVLRFKETMETLPENMKKTLEDLKELISFNRNYEKLRKFIKESKPPLIPCLNIILRDINQLDVENEWVFVKDKEFLNLKKMEKLGEIVENVITSQKPYAFAKKPFFYNFFEDTFKRILIFYVNDEKIENIEGKLFEITRKNI